MEEVQRRRQNVKFCEGWVQHKVRHHSGGSQWEKLWLVMKGNVIYIFKSRDTSAENQVGNLTVDSESRFVPRGGDKEKGFKFDLTTGKRLNTFKTEKNSERELWRANIVGLSKGQVPSDIDLLDNEVQRIQREIDSYISGNPLSSEPNNIYRESKVSSDESGVVVSIGPQDGFSIGRASYSGSGSSGSRSASTFVEHGGPTNRHKFVHDGSPDRPRDQTPPSWFFSHCSRQQAETILQRGESYGNTLMRESTSYKDNGSYVISKLVRKQGVISFEHYEVMRTAGGYKVNVENPHAAMKTLTQVMDYFVTTSGGPEHTRPMTTNDLSALGLHDPDYDRTIRLGFQILDDDSDHDYEDATSPTLTPTSPYKFPQQSKSLGTADSRKVGGILKQPQSGNSGKTVGFNPNVHHTVAGSRYIRQKEPPTMGELVNRYEEEAELQNLDDVIDGFEPNHDYINEDESNKLFKGDQQRQRQGRDHTPPPPPLPQPHTLQTKKPPYANIQDPEDQLESAVVLKSLPVAPPAPRDPIPKPPSTFPAIPSQRPTGQTKLHSSHSFSPNSSNRPIASVQPTTPTSPSDKGVNLRLSHSEEQFKGPSEQIGSPSAFPSWRENLKPVKQIQKSETAKDTMEETAVGIDTGNPGGVNTLRGKFERASTGDPSTVLKHASSSFDDGYVNVEASSSFDDGYVNVEAFMRGGGKVKTRRALSSVLPLTTNEEELYEIIPEENQNTTRHWSVSSNKETEAKFYLSSSPGDVNKPPSKCGTTGGDDNYYDASAVDDIYDDTENPEDAVIYKAEHKKVQFQNTVSEPDQTSRLAQRRKTEPCVSVSKKEFEGLNPDFKSKLEGLIGGGTSSQATVGPKVAGGSRPNSGALTEDHIYAELPPIEPDEVFYVNARYNKET